MNGGTELANERRERKSPPVHSWIDHCVTVDEQLVSCESKEVKEKNKRKAADRKRDRQFPEV